MICEAFKGCIEQDFEKALDDSDNDIFINVRGNSAFLSELLACLKTQLDSALTIIGTSSEIFERNDIIHCLALYALYRRLLPSNVEPDGKLHKALWAVQKVVPFVIIYEKTVWKVGDFLTSYAPFYQPKPDPPNSEVNLRQFMSTFDASLGQRAAALVSQCTAWMILAESKLQPSLRHDTNLSQTLDIRGSILLKGLALASRAAYLAKSTLVIHSFMQIPMTKANLNDVGLLLENLKAIEFTFTRKDMVVSENMTQILQLTSAAILACIQPFRLTLDTKKSDGNLAKSDGMVKLKLFFCYKYNLYYYYQGCFNNIRDYPEVVRVLQLLSPSGHQPHGRGTGVVKVHQ